jgi:hypothetical protein
LDLRGSSQALSSSWYRLRTNGSAKRAEMSWPSRRAFRPPLICHADARHFPPRGGKTRPSFSRARERGPAEPAGSGLWGAGAPFDASRLAGRPKPRCQRDKVFLETRIYARVIFAGLD